MRIATLTALSILALAACSPDIPDSAAGLGADPAVTASGASTLPPANPVATAPLDESEEAASIAAETTAVLGPASTDTPETAPAPEAVAETGISNEQNFAAVSERRSIDSDAARIADNRAQYVVIEPKELPPRPDNTGPSIVAYALATTNVPGQQLYERGIFASQERYERACARFGHSDRAQEAFLDAGGPQRDRYGMDPDGDGFACDWDPRPFRTARQAAAAETVGEP